MIDVPSIVTSHNLFMNESDSFDQLWASLQTAQQNWKLFMSIFVFLLDNSNQSEYALCQSKKNPTPKQCRWKNSIGLLPKPWWSRISVQTRRACLCNVTYSADRNMFRKPLGSCVNTESTISALRSAHDDDESDVYQTPRVLLPHKTIIEHAATCVDCAILPSRNCGATMHDMHVPLPFISTAMRLFTMLVSSKNAMQMYVQNLESYCAYLAILQLYKRTKTVLSRMHSSSIMCSFYLVQLSLNVNHLCVVIVLAATHIPKMLRFMQSLKTLIMMMFSFWTWESTTQQEIFDFVQSVTSLWGSLQNKFYTLFLNNVSKANLLVSSSHIALQSVLSTVFPTASIFTEIYRLSFISLHLFFMPKTLFRIQSTNLSLTTVWFCMQQFLRGIFRQTLQASNFNLLRLLPNSCLRSCTILSKLFPLIRVRPAHSPSNEVQNLSHSRLLCAISDKYVQHNSLRR